MTYRIRGPNYELRYRVGWQPYDILVLFRRSLGGRNRSRMISRRLSKRELLLQDDGHCLSSLLMDMNVPVEAQEPVLQQISEVARSAGTSTIAIGVTFYLSDGYDNDDEVVDTIIRAHEAKLIPPTKSSIEALEKVTLQQELDSVAACVICTQEFEAGLEVTRMPCSHVYHEECIVKWLKRSNVFADRWRRLSSPSIAVELAVGEASSRDRWRRLSSPIATLELAVGEASSRRSLATLPATLRLPFTPVTFRLPFAPATLRLPLVLDDGNQTQENSFIYPTQYPTSEELSIGKIKFKAFDLGGHQIARREWTDYYDMVDSVVYLVDAYDKERFAESKKELDALLSNEALANVLFLILGNKIDIPDAASEDELRFHLGLTNFTTGKGKVKINNKQKPPMEESSDDSSDVESSDDSDDEVLLERHYSLNLHWLAPKSLVLIEIRGSPSFLFWKRKKKFLAFMA
ncbi:hypothetical protein SO802_031531 [Lithocarpus litseifolius]|uniref:RING-type domain-containing protein n=1 Tax=Lithocarpus litseifolius TaxID=425828 RepID=A0AAW2BRB3_9ROSI